MPWLAEAEAVAVTVVASGVVSVAATLEAALGAAHLAATWADSPGTWEAVLEAAILPKDSPVATSWDGQAMPIRPVTIGFGEPTAIGRITAGAMTTSMVIPATTTITRTETTAAITRIMRGEGGRAQLTGSA